MQKALSGAVIASAIALLSLPALGADRRAYEFITIDLPDGLEPGGFYGAAGGINDRGWIVGAYGGIVSKAFLDTGRTFTTLDLPSTIQLCCALKPNGVNNRGKIVGIFYALVASSILPALSSATASLPLSMCPACRSGAPKASAT